MVEFLRRLMRQRRRRVFLIVDGHPVHRSAKVLRWIESQGGRLRIFYLPGYSPELNPDEYLNHDVKSNAVGRLRPIDQPQMLDMLRTYLRSTQRRPQIVRSYFRAKDVAYAAA
jgi:transposase